MFEHSESDAHPESNEHSETLDRVEGPWTLERVRAGIDDVDQRIVALIAERQRLVLVAGSLKRDEQGVRAPARVEQVIERVRRVAEDAEASPDVVERAYRAMIAAFIDLELRQHRNG